MLRLTGMMMLLLMLLLLLLMMMMIAVGHVAATILHLPCSRRERGRRWERQVIIVLVVGVAVAVVVVVVVVTFQLVRRRKPVR